MRVRGQASARAYQALIRVEALDQLFGALVALSDLLEASRDPAVREGRNPRPATVAARRCW